jgi:hypothetical protein
VVSVDARVVSVDPRVIRAGALLRARRSRLVLARLVLSPESAIHLAADSLDAGDDAVALTASCQSAAHRHALRGYGPLVRRL